MCTTSASHGDYIPEHLYQQGQNAGIQASPYPNDQRTHPSDELENPLPHSRLCSRADIKECFRLKSIKLADNQMVIQNHPKLGFSDSLSPLLMEMILE